MKERLLKEGERVVCVDDSCHSYYHDRSLRFGQEYLVSKVDGDLIHVEGIDRSWSRSRFKPIDKIKVQIPGIGKITLTPRKQHATDSPG